jgi:hypothetical protein
MMFPAFSCLVFLCGVKVRFAEQAFRIPVRRSGIGFPQLFHPSWMRSPWSGKLNYFWWLNGFWLESRGLFAKSKRGFKAQAPIPDAVH